VSDDAVAGVGQAGINAENDHSHVILRSLPDACLSALSHTGPPARRCRGDVRWRLG
jgi:hypothetical protein